MYSLHNDRNIDSKDQIRLVCICRWGCTHDIRNCPRSASV